MKLRIKRKILRLAAVILTAAVCLASAGCGSNDPTYAEREQLIEELYGAVELEGAVQTGGGTATTSNFTLAYSKEDTVNPYMCTSTLNATLSELIYDQLITVNSEFEADMVIALKMEYSGSRVITVTLRDGVVFSDGTALTGADVAYSFNAARAEGSRYKEALSCFQSCSHFQNEVYFRLNEPDPRGYMLLDFPIIKANSDANNATPIGSGRYVFYSDLQTGTYLIRNDKWYSTHSGNIQRISLTSMPTVDSIIYSVEIGTITYYYTDLRDGKPGRINANYTNVDINNLVYLGVNTTEPTLQRTSVRKAISHALNREDIITAAYAGRAYAATGPLTTSWPVAAVAQNGSTLSSVSSAISALNGDGFANEDASRGYHRYNESGQYLEYELLVNHDNERQMNVAEQIAMQLDEVGIGITIKGVSFSQLESRIAAGDYDLYLAEYAVRNNMDISKLFTPNLGLYYGQRPQQTIDSWNNYLNGMVGIESFIASFETEMPFIPVCYRLGMVCCSRSLDVVMDISESDPFKGLEKWEVALAE